jgi:1-deoxy-D-xylulose-5-phosphate synthase
MYHSPGMFNKTTGEIIEKACVGKIAPKYQTVFGRTIIELAEINPKIVGITPAMLTGCSLDLMMQKMPNRVFDVGIAEQHAVTFAAGMAANGYVPFCNIYSSFMQRSYDQIIHDVALQKLKVIFILDRAGLVGEDGPTHHGAFDLAYMRSIPNIIVSSPMNEQELRNLMFTAQSQKNQLPFSIRYPRGRGVMPEWKTSLENITVGKGRKLRNGNDVAIISIGHPGNFAMQAAEILEKENIHIAVFDMRFLKPIDEELLHEAMSLYKTIITVEDGTIIGGLGSVVQEFASNNKYNINIHKLGIPDSFIEQGTPEELYAFCGYDVQGIIKTVKSL